MSNLTTTAFSIDSHTRAVSVGDRYMVPGDSYDPSRVFTVTGIEDSYITVNITNAYTGAVMSEARKMYNNDFKSTCLNAKSVALLPGEDVGQMLREAAMFLDSGEPNVTPDNLTGTEIVHTASKDALISAKNALEVRMRTTELKRAFVRAEMDNRRRALEKKLQGLNDMVTAFKEGVTRLTKIITTIELYLGINEEMTQIQAGDTAGVDEPITFRQQILYMDEELGLWENGGADFTDIPLFEEWLTTGGNYKTILPEPKSVVVFRPRRNAKEYSDVWLNAMLNDNNKMTYILIRNGDNLYRIFTANIRIHPRLFPKRNEFEQLLKRVNSDHWYNEKDVQNTADHYRNQAILMQGLIDRTEVFFPLAPDTSVFTNTGVSFVFDDEATLPDGRKPFKKWVQDLNSGIKEGSRIAVTGTFSKDDIVSSIYYHVNEWNVPKRPQEGIYSVEEYAHTDFKCMDDYEVENFTGRIVRIDPREEMESRLKGRHEVEKGTFVIGGERENVRVRRVTFEIIHNTILYNPGDYVRTGAWGRDGEEKRKKRVRLRIDDHMDKVLHYDGILLEELDYYMNSRAERPNYLEMMPVLCRVRKQRMEELEKERGFVTLILSRNEGVAAPEVLEQTVWQVVDWWKHKNKWKRGLEADGAKAVRMVETELKRRLAYV